MFKKNLNLQFFLALATVIAATVIICVCTATCSGGKLDFNQTYYFVCYRMSDNAVSAGSLSQTVTSYGGAGYVLHHGDNYYVTFSCYYKRDEADTVCANLKKRELDCSVLEIEAGGFSLGNRNAKNNEKLYLGNLNTLNSLSTLAYKCANGLDTGEYPQNNAKQILASITDALNEMLTNNPDNCFTPCIESLLDECKSVSGGYLLSKNMRYIQIALADKIINIKLN